MDGPSAASRYGHSFPQPDDANDNSQDSDSESDTSFRQDTERISSVVIVDSPSEQGVDFRTVPGAGNIKNSERLKTSSKQKLSISPPHSNLRVPQKKGRQSSSRSDGDCSFVTAREARISEPPQHSLLADDKPIGQPEAISPNSFTEETSTPDEVTRFSTANSFSGGITRTVDGTTSTSSLLPHGNNQANIPESQEASSRGQQAKSAEIPTQVQDVPPEEYLDTSRPIDIETGAKKSLSAGLVRFNIPNDPEDGETQTKAKYAGISHRGSLRHFRRAKLDPGEIVKVEKVLIRIDFTLHELPADYDENDSLKSESRTIEKWREFVVVCRKGTEGQAEFVLQMYKSRVIPAIERPQLQKRSAHSIPLSRKSTKLNLYSSLDKTIVIWVPWNEGTKIYILRPQSSASSVEWYTFLRDILGRARSDTLQVNVPDLDVTLQLDKPFEDLERARDAARSENEDVSSVLRTMAVERAVAGSIVERCLTMLENSPEWCSIMQSWLKHEKMGLAWKRYDRLEWIHGANEQKMYGTLAMQKTHELELRPKQHYPTRVQTIEEPTPVEGFLVRLTSQKGRDQRFGKKFSKRLYFSTHNQFLCYCKPGKAKPPPPPKPLAGHGEHSRTMDDGETPLIYAINPYPLDDRAHVSWLAGTSSGQKKDYDQNAYEESQRKVNTLLSAEGYVNLCHVECIRPVQRQKPSTDKPFSSGESRGNDDDVTNDASVEGDETEDDNSNRTFELLLRNGLVVKFQAYDQITRKEWMIRLDRIVDYWKRRVADDMMLYKLIRQTNLDRLNIDEEMESLLGQSAEKWEVSRSVASPQLFNMCGISCCRSITVSKEYLILGRLFELLFRCLVSCTTSHAFIPHSNDAESSFVTAAFSYFKALSGNPLAKKFHTFIMSDNRYST